MTAARLDELAAKCDEVLALDTPDIASVLELTDIADLARCARAWAEREAWVASSSTLVEIIGYRGREHPWAAYPTRSDNRRFTGPTAIEAVEAAEVNQ